MMLGTPRRPGVDGIGKSKIMHWVLLFDAENGKNYIFRQVLDIMIIILFLIIIYDNTEKLGTLRLIVPIKDTLEPV